MASGYKRILTVWKQHQDKLFEINRSLSHSHLWVPMTHLVLNGSSGFNHIFPFIIVFQHMNHLMGDNL